MSAEPSRTIRRVLVALDASPASRAAADSAARLAALLEAELVGIFVEDHHLLRLSESALAHQIDYLTASVARLEGDDMRRQLRAQAVRARDALSRTASQRGVAWKFRVVRGEVTREILAASDEADVVSLGRFGWSQHHARRLGSTARSLLGRRHRRTLLTARTFRPGRPVAVFYDGSAAGRDALELAARLVQSPVVLSTAELRPRASELLGDRGADARFVEIPESTHSGLGRAAHRVGAGLLLLPVPAEGMPDEEMQALLAEIDCPVLAVS